MRLERQRILVDPDFSDEDRERMEVVASEVVADISDETLATIFMSSSTDGPRVPVAERWRVYERFEPNAMSVERKLEWPFVLQILALVDRLFQEKASWPELIKQIRGASGMDILTGEKDFAPNAQDIHARMCKRLVAAYSYVRQIKTAWSKTHKTLPSFWKYCYFVVNVGTAWLRRLRE